MSLLRLSTAFGLIAGPALAHPGHLVAAAGHDHWVAGAALGAAAAIALWGLLKGRKDDAEDPEDAATDETEEAAA